jgi:hypothetical protein
MQVDPNEVVQTFRAWRHDQSRKPDVLCSQGVELYKGAQVYKSASLRVFGDRENGSVYRTELRVGTTILSQG